MSQLRVEITQSLLIKTNSYLLSDEESQGHVMKTQDVRLSAETHWFWVGNMTVTKEEVKPRN